MEWLLLIVLGVVWAISPFIALARMSKLRTELRAIRERLDGVEARLAALQAAPAEPSGSTAPAPIPVASPPSPLTGSAELSLPLEALAFEHPPQPGIEAAPVTAASVQPASPIAPSVEPAAPGASGEKARLEDRIGGIWLQNIGAVVLLLGVFFMILWGYTTGRFGPGWLVVAGIGLGLTFAWRGDRLSRALPRLGYALIGVGTGVVYLSLYLGHFTLHVLSLPVTFALLALTSFLTIVSGLRYGVQIIAALGVVGAFLPQFLATWIPLDGFSLAPAVRLGYLAMVDVLVFTLAARAGWSALDLSALVLTALTWSAAYPRGEWSWAVTISLSALFTGLGLAPLPRLLRTEGRVRLLDLAVIAGAPAALILTLATWLWHSSRTPVAMLLLMLGAIQLVAALWVDRRRPERDLWKPLTGAATVFLTAGLQRVAGDENTAMVWCIEGVALVGLGLGPGGGWLRFWGYLVSGISALVAFNRLSQWSDFTTTVPFVGVSAIRELVVIAGLLTGATLLARSRAVLSAGERWLPEAWTGAANITLAIWLGRECGRLSYAIENPGGRWWRGVSLAAPAGSQRQIEFFAALLGFAWFAQGAALAALGSRQGRGFLRGCAYAAGSFALVVTLTALVQFDGWSSDQRPIFHPSGLLELSSLALAVVISWRFAARRGELRFEERFAPEAWLICVMLLLLAWSAREADHIARAANGLGGVNGHEIGLVPPASRMAASMLGAALTSASWMVEAIVLLVIGWVRNAPILRWAGLTLIGVTFLKFAFFDLAKADVFWRFLIAIAAGAVMLAVSYAYQRKTKRS